MKANKYFYKIDNQGNPIPGTLARFNRKPKQGQWVEVANVCCPNPNCESSTPTLNWWYTTSTTIGNFTIEVNGTPIVELINEADNAEGTYTPAVGDIIDVYVENTGPVLATDMSISGQENVFFFNENPSNYSFVWTGLITTHILAHVVGFGE